MHQHTRAQCHLWPQSQLPKVQTSSDSVRVSRSIPKSLHSEVRSETRNIGYMLAVQVSMSTLADITTIWQSNLPLRSLYKKYVHAKTPTKTRKEYRSEACWSPLPVYNELRIIASISNPTLNLANLQFSISLQAHPRSGPGASRLTGQGGMQRCLNWVCEALCQLETSSGSYWSYRRSVIKLDHRWACDDRTRSSIAGSWLFYIYKW